MERRRPEQIVFDLVEGEHEIDGTGHDGREQGSPRRSAGGELLRDLGSSVLAGMVAARGWVSRHRVVSLVVTGVAAAVVLAAAALDTVREHERVDLLRTAPGGVESLAEPPLETWRYAPRGDTNLIDRYGLGTGSVVLGRNVVFLDGEQSGMNRSRLDAPDERVRWSDADLVAVDPRSGAEAWRVPLGTDPECTPPEAGGTSRVLNEITCLVGPAGERHAVTVTGDGDATGPRRLAPVDDARDTLLPVGGGLILRARVTGDVPDLDCSGAEVVPHGCRVSGGPPDRELVVRAEAASTGEVAWRKAVPWNGDLGDCHEQVAGDEGTGDLARRLTEPDLPAVTVWASVVTVRTCGIAAAFLADGTMFAGGDLVIGGHVASGDRLVSEQSYDPETGEISTTVRTTDGQEVLTTDGWVMENRATDGTPSDLIVIGAGQNGWTRAYRPDGTLVWESQDPGQFIARAGSIGVFERPSLTWLGIDLRTGRDLWERDGTADGPGGARTAFTDGSALTLVTVPTGLTTVVDDDGTVVSRDTGRAQLVTIDVGSGRTRWTLEHEDTTWFSADGRLLSVADDGALVGHG